MSAVDAWQRLATSWGPARRATPLAHDVAVSSRSWGALLRAVDDGTIRLSLRDQNRILDGLALQTDAENEVRANARRLRLLARRRLEGGR
jgi:hypothetical protein